MTLNRLSNISKIYSFTCISRLIPFADYGLTMSLRSSA